MRDPQKRDPDPNLIKIDPGTLVAIVSVLLLVPLLFMGFLFQ